MKLQHVLFILTNAAKIGPHDRATGFFFSEVAHPFEVLDDAGIAVEFASPKGGVVPWDAYDEKDAAQRAFHDSKAFGRLAKSRRLSEVDVRDYDAIFFPGGLGPMVDIVTDPDVKQAIRRAWDGGQIIGAVCHGPAALLGVKLDDGTPLVRGKKLTSFSTAEEEGYAKADVPFMLEDALRAEGADYASAPVWREKVVIDGKLMTGQNPASAGPLAKAIVAELRKPS